MTRSLLIFTLAAVAILFQKCDQPFDPRGPLDQHMSIFSVLSTDRNIQFVRVTAPYMAEDYNPDSYYSYDNTVTDAVVDVSRSAFTVYEGFKRLYPAEHYPGRDTMLARPAGSLYTYPLHLFAAGPLAIEYGKKYDISVSSRAHGAAAMSVVVPGRPSIEMFPRTYFILEKPSQYKATDTIGYKLTLSNLAKGYVARLYVDFGILKGSEWIDERVEIPLLWPDTTFSSLVGAIYPRLNETVTTKQLNVVWQLGYLGGIIHQVAFVRYNNFRVVYKRLVLYLLQTDANLYSYTIADQVNGDPRSIRLDQPLYPRISGGHYGMVGAYTLDSLVYLAPGALTGSRR